jgi:hypothetical protein
MHQLTYNYLGRRASHLASLLVLTLITHPILAQERSPGPLKGSTPAQWPSHTSGKCAIQISRHVKARGGQTSRSQFAGSSVHFSADLQTQQQTPAPAKQFLDFGRQVDLPAAESGWWQHAT